MQRSHGLTWINLDMDAVRVSSGYPALSVLWFPYKR